MWFGDDITWCMAKCKTDCPRQPRYIRDKSIPHSFADFSKECMAYRMKGADDAKEGIQIAERQDSRV